MQSRTEDRVRVRGRQAARTLAVAEHVVGAYVAARAALRELGILRSERTLQGDFAEWLAAGVLGLTLSESTIQRDFDATDRRGRKYQIKSRLVRHLRQTTSFDFKSSELGFDFLLAVFFSPALEVLGILQVPKAAVVAHSVQNANSYRFRWHRTTAADPRLRRLYWTEVPTPKTSGEASTV